MSSDFISVRICVMYHDQVLNKIQKVNQMLIAVATTSVIQYCQVMNCVSAFWKTNVGGYKARI